MGKLFRTKFEEEFKEKYETKIQIVKAPKGWKQWSVVPASSSSIRIVWAKPRKSRLKRKQRRK